MKREQMLDKLRYYGIKNPENPSKEEMEKTLELVYFKEDNDLTKELFRDYVKTINPTVDSIIGGIKVLAENKTSDEYVDSIKGVIEMLKNDYEKAETEEEKNRVYDKIENQSDRIKEEVGKQRTWKQKMAIYSIGTAAVVGGVGYAIATKNTKPLEKGLQTLKYLK